MKPVILLSCALMLGGCESLDSLNIFEAKKTPLAGERKPVFPGGVPGVEYGAPPAQPTNSNISIDPSQPQAAQPEAESGRSTTKSKQRTARTPAPSAETAKPATRSDDPWSDTRSR